MIRYDNLSQMLMDLDFDIGSKGFTYWYYAVKIYDGKITLENLYKKLAEKLHVKNYKSIERCMRTATTDKTKAQLLQIFNYNKFSNSTILNILYLKYNEEMKQ